MIRNEVLTQLSDQKISIKRAYKNLYNKKRFKKARFIKLKIQIYDEKLITFFLRTLFIFPLPISFLKFILKRSNRKISKDSDINIRDFLKMNLTKNSFINIVDSDSTKISIKAV